MRELSDVDIEIREKLTELRTFIHDRRNITSNVNKTMSLMLDLQALDYIFTKDLDTI